MKITGEEAERLTFEDFVDGITVVQRQHEGSRRWAEDWSAVVTRDRKRFWLFMYEEPATEMQEAHSYEDDEEITLQEVFPIEKTVVVYE